MVFYADGIEDRPVLDGMEVGGDLHQGFGSLILTEKILLAGLSVLVLEFGALNVFATLIFSRTRTRCWE